MEQSRVIGVDVGGTKILAAVVSRDGSLGTRIERPSEHPSQDALLEELDSMVEELHRAEPDVQALGFGIPSRIDQRAGRALKSVNIPLEGVDLRDRMRERHGLPVALDNDANAAAIAEWRAGAARGARHVVMLTLGTGVGGGLILDGRPYRGATGSGAELGHIVIEPGGPPCGCGGHGHLESFAAGPAADGVARSLYGDGVERARARPPAAGRASPKPSRRWPGSAGTWAPASRASSMSSSPRWWSSAAASARRASCSSAPAREVVAIEGLEPARDTVRIVEASSAPTPA